MCPNFDNSLSARTIFAYNIGQEFQLIKALILHIFGRICIVLFLCIFSYKVYLSIYAFSPPVQEASQVSIVDVKTTDGAFYLELKLPSKFRLCAGFWNFLERYGFRYGDSLTRTLLASEVWNLLLCCFKLDFCYYDELWGFFFLDIFYWNHCT